MASFSLKVTTPEKIFFDGETTQIIVRTTEGDIGILANHIAVALLPMFLCVILVLMIVMYERLVKKSV